MRIMKLTTAGIKPVVATCYKRLKNNDNNLFYSITHGTIGNILWKWTAGLSSSDFSKPKDIGDRLELSTTDDSYYIRPILNNKKPATDKLGNTLYLVAKDDMGLHRFDVLLLWEIPSMKFGSCVQYRYSDNVSEIGIGYSGKERNSTIIKIPQPILEISGNAKLEWVGYDIDNETMYKQLFTYDYVSGKWSIGPVEIEEATVDKFNDYSKNELGELHVNTK